MFSQKLSFKQILKGFLWTKNNDSFIINATNKEEICKVISSLNIDKSCGPNGIPTKTLHLIQDQISRHLATIPANHAILNLLEIIQKALGDGQIACGIFINLEKSFGTVSHDILLEKLDHYGNEGISNDWFRSYLNDRSQLFSINGFNFDYQTIKYGVPQSSVLDHLLFIIFINDLNTAIKHSETFHFGNDTCLLNIKDQSSK